MHNKPQRAEKTLKACFSETLDALKTCSSSPFLDARLFIREVCNITDTDFFTKSNLIISQQHVKKIQEYVAKRQKGLPVAYILGHKDFYNLTFYTPEEVLIPRPDTEILVENAVDTIASRFSEGCVSILDLCAGTGCIGISVALNVCEKRKSLKIKLFLSDISKASYNCFSINAEKMLKKKRVEVYKGCGNLFETFETEKFDFILTNPPYIESSVISSLSLEVQSEPLIALDGGEDGLFLIRKIICLSPLYLNKGGFLFMEISYNQGDKVKQIFEQNGFSDVKILKDYSANDRVVYGSL